jgi:putative membrane protein
MKLKQQNHTMLHIFNSKLPLLPATCLAGLLFLASSCSENRTADSKEIAKQENISKMAADDKTIVVIENDNDVRFLMDAAEMQLEKISLGKLAQERGSSAHVKELGRMMEEDHTKSLTELKALAQSKSVSIPSTITEDSKDTYEDLEEKSGNDFGKAYSDKMVEHHENAIDKFEKAATDAEDPEIRAWASQRLPSLRTHLDHAKACKEKCDKMKS